MRSLSQTPKSDDETKSSNQLQAGLSSLPGAPKFTVAGTADANGLTSRQQKILGMQHRLGNAAVVRMLAQRKPASESMPSANKAEAPSEPTSYITQHFTAPVTATIRRVKKPTDKKHQSEKPNKVPVILQDAPPGNEDPTPEPTQFLSIEPDSTSGDITDPTEGQTVTLPDITFANVEEVPFTDAIASSLAFASTVTNSGSPNSGDFGTTVPSVPTLSGITVTAASGSFTVSATINYSVRYAYLTGAGLGRTDVTSDTSPAIRAGNYTTVASDLTPNMSDLGGRPPRTQFFASDLTARHERFHADDSVNLSRSAVTVSQTWLNTQTASSAADVNTLLGQVPGRVFSAMMAGMAMPGREVRAYGDGASSYQARATSISTKGAAGQYPA